MKRGIWSDCGDQGSDQGCIIITAWSMFGRYHGDKVNADPDLVTEKHFSIDDSNIDVRGEVIGTRKWRRRRNPWKREILINFYESTEKFENLFDLKTLSQFSLLGGERFPPSCLLSQQILSVFVYQSNADINIRALVQLLIMLTFLI